MKQNERPATEEVVEATIEQLQDKIDYLAEKRLEIKNELPKLEQLRRENKEPVGSPLRDAIDAQYNRKVQRYQNIHGQIAKYSDRIQTLQIILKNFRTMTQDTKNTWSMIINAIIVAGSMILNSLGFSIH